MNIQLVTSKDLMFTLMVAAIASLLILIYRSYIRLLSRDIIDKRNYAKLERIEDEIVSGIIELYFVVRKDEFTVMELLTSTWNFQAVIVYDHYKAGGHVIQFDTTTVPNGTYFYQLKTGNNTNAKKIIIQNGSNPHYHSSPKTLPKTGYSKRKSTETVYN